MLKSSDNPPEQQYRPEFLHQLIQNHSLAFWGGLWVTLIVLGSMATLGLLSPSSLKEEVSQPKPTLETIQQLPPTSKPKPKEDLPLSLFGGVVLGCAAGSFLVTQVLKHASKRHRSAKRLKPTKRVRKKRRPSAKPPRPSPKARHVIETEPTYPITDYREPSITVLPPEQPHPLDGGKENLADLLDLRKRQSLASLMRQNK